jgi:tetratricopeptide (TPR) repeat protein
VGGADAGADRTLDADVLAAEVTAAREDFQLGRPSRAATRLRALKDRLGSDTPEDMLVPRARMSVTLAAAEHELSGDLEASMRLLGDAERLAARCASEGLIATVRGQRGLLLLRSGKVGRAIDALDSAVELIASADDADQMSILLNRGTAHLEAGSLDVARRDFEDCVAVAVRAGNRDHETKARHNLGYAEFLAGRIPRALAAMERASATLNEGSRNPISLLDRARVLREAGLTSDATRLLTTAVELFNERRLWQDAAEAQLTLAECLLVEGTPADALRLARLAEQTFAGRGNSWWERQAQLLVLRCERGAATRLEPVAERASSLASRCREENRQDLAETAELLAAECRLRSGADPSVVVPVLPAVRGSDPLQTRLQRREVRALAAMARSDHPRAAAEIRRGLDDLALHVNRFGSLDLRTASAVHGVSLARLGMELAEQSGSAAELFAAVERGRAISTRLARVAPPDDTRTAELLSELRRCEEELREAGTAELRARSARLQRDIRARAWELEADQEHERRPAARVSDIREATRSSGTAFATYVVHRGRWLAVLASGRRAVAHDLAGTAEVDELVQRVRADLDALALPRLPPPLMEAVRRSLDAGLRRLDELLLGPLRVAGTPLVVSCSTSLALLPWSLLPSRRGIPVVVTPSASWWLRNVATSRRTRPRVVALAGPGLQRAEDEANQVAAHWSRSEVATGASATTEEGRRALTGSDVVHVAAHGTHQQESPLFSSLRLADGPLYAYELAGGESTAACVVLSACEAGLATVRPGDEGLGLTSVLLHLGSRSVLAGVARVGDDVAARVMGRVHGRMAAGSGSAEALAESLAEEPDAASFVSFGVSW